MALNPAQDPILHLLRRAAYGPTPALAAEVCKAGTTAWLDAQLTPLIHGVPRVVVGPAGRGPAEGVIPRRHDRDSPPWRTGRFVVRRLDLVVLTSSPWLVVLEAALRFHRAPMSFLRLHARRP